MSERFAYTPPHQKLLEKKSIPNTPLMDEIEQIVDTAFGNDYEADILRLNEARIHAEGCGCGACRKAYQELENEVALRYVKNPHEM